MGIHKIVEAIYENGIFRPLKSPELDEGQPVQLIIQARKKLEPFQMLQLAAEVYEGLSVQEIEAIEQIALEQV